MFKIELIQVDLIEIELFQLDTLINKIFGGFDSIRKKKIKLVIVIREKL